MADFCSLRISTVTGQVSLMPQTAVTAGLLYLNEFIHIYYNLRCFVACRLSHNRKKAGCQKTDEVILLVRDPLGETHPFDTPPPLHVNI